MLMVRWIRALALGALGRYREVMLALESVSEVGRGEELFWHARVPNTHASFLADLCQHPQSLEKNLEALEISCSSHYGLIREAQIHTRLNIAGDLLTLGRVHEARSQVEIVRRDFTDVKYARYRWLCRLHALDSETALAEEDAERAYAAAESCLATAAKYEQRKYEVRGGMAKARALGALGEGTRAKRAARCAAALAEQLGMRGLEWRAYQLAYELGEQQADLHHAERVVAWIAEGVEEPLRSKFLAEVRLRR